ncbi:hypothetical protein HFP89_03805 [Wenzhouxiangella sp. XN79A]|uniref:hypothetical protein n=1 Tax=Wenzhouxiangella sp. XN79A TaxID=2724193 RepID=UPI00144A7ED7|nr:hypothetical protein [Wenzhouxiangella sp. XN79A]NKI34284.1 hypothetical protein [Wenzhouxiangella sp. XN79A]
MVKTNRTSIFCAMVLLAVAGCATVEPPAEGERQAASQREGKAMLSGRPAIPNRDLFAVRFIAIDGRNISPRDILWVEPGPRTITVEIPRRFTESLINQQRETWPDFVDIELELKPRHAYEIRGRYNRTDRDNPYDIVVDRVQSFERD